MQKMHFCEPVEKDVYVISLRKWKTRNFCSQLLAATRGLVYGHAKWQIKSGHMFCDVEMVQCIHIFYVLLIRSSESIYMMVAKIADVILI